MRTKGRVPMFLKEHAGLYGKIAESWKTTRLEKRTVNGE